MTYCKLSNNEKRHTCSITDKISENSKDKMLYLQNRKI